MALFNVAEFPEWIPRCLVDELNLYEQLDQTAADDECRAVLPNADEEKPILERLLNDQSIQRTWRALAVKCQEKQIDFEKMARNLWHTISWAIYTVRNVTETRSQRMETLTEASKKLRHLAIFLNRNHETRSESDFFFFEMIESGLKQACPNAENVRDVLLDGVHAVPVMINEPGTKLTVSTTDALGAVLRYSFTDAVKDMADRLDALKTVEQSVSHVGKLKPTLIRELNRYFIRDFGQPLDDTVAEIANAVLNPPPDKLLTRTDIRSYTEKKKS